MKTLSLVVSLLLLSVIVFMLMREPAPDAAGKDQRIVKDLPWIIQTDTQGGSRVLGLNIGKSTVRQAADKFASEVEIGVFLDPDKTLSLEAYFDRVTLSGLLARVALELEAEQQELHEMALQSIEKKAMPSNAWQFRLPNEVKEQLMSRRFISLSYMPKVSIESDILRKRFGEPGSVIEVDDANQLWLYPEKGLVINVMKDGKPLFQYVRPDEFQRLKQAVSSNR
jgi:hypothetical protein